MKKAILYSVSAILVFSSLLAPGVTERLTVRAQEQEEAPELKKIHPRVITAGTRTFTIRLDGRRFANEANVLFDGVALASPRIGRKGKVLLAEVDASLIASPGTHTVQAINPDGATTTSATLTVGAQDPNLQIRLDGNAAEEDSGLIFLPTLATDSYEDGSDVLVWGGITAEAAVKGGVQFEIPGDLVNDPASIPITLVASNGNLSNTELFFIVPIPALIHEIDPPVLEVGTEDVFFIVTGVFKPGATIFVNDMELATAIGKNDRLEATLPGSLRSQPTQLVVRVDQEGSQSLDTILPVTPTTEPFIFNLAPIQIRQGDDDKVSIDVIGANFGKKVIAFVDGVEAFVRVANKTHLTVALERDVALGTHTVEVKDRDGNTTETATFEVVPDLTVSTLAGTGKAGFDLECVSKEEATLRRPRRMIFGPDGLLYITDQQNHAIRTINVNTGQMCTLAGTGEEGYHDSGNALGKAPTFSFPNGIALDSSGTIFITENGNSVVRRIRRSGANITVDTVAGLFKELTGEKQTKFNSTREGIASYRDAGLFESAFRQPDGIVVAPDGTIYIADAGNSVIRRITQNGGQSVVETIAGNGVPGFADGDAERARFNIPTALALSADGNFLFVADTRNNRVRKVDLVNRRVSTVAGGAEIGATFDGKGGQAVLLQPVGLALDSDGTLYVAELGLNDIRRIDPEGNVTSVAGAEGGFKLRDGPGIDARFNLPRGLAIDTQRGILYIADYENFAIRSIALR